MENSTAVVEDVLGGEEVYVWYLTWIREADNLCRGHCSSMCSIGDFMGRN